MSLNLDQIKKTVRDLLNLAENDAATEGEISNAIKFARRYMDVHQLSEEECRLAGQKVEKFLQSTVYGETKNMAYWETRLTGFVVEMIKSIGYFKTHRHIVKNEHGFAKLDGNGNPMEKVGITYYGTDEDVALAVDMYEGLHATVATMARLKYGGAQRGDGRTYCEGFCEGLFRKLREAEQQDKIDVQSTALIVRSTEIAKATNLRARNWLAKEQNIKLRKGSSQRRYVRNDIGAYTEGVNDGKSTDTNVSRKAKLTGNNGYIN